MSAIVSDCCSSCPAPVPVQVPGPQGSNGVNGAPAYTTVGTGGFSVPSAVNNTVNIPVVTSAWAFVGAFVAVQNATSTADLYVVTAVPDATHITLKYLNFPTNTNFNASIPAGNIVAPGGATPGYIPLNPANNLSDVASVSTTLSNLGLGSTPVGSYSVSGTQALATSGGGPGAQLLSTSVTLVTGAKYFLLATARFDYVGATFAANQTITYKLRRTNNIAGDITNSQGILETAVITTLSYTAGYVHFPPVYYATVGTSDIVQPYGFISATPSAGSVQVVECGLLAVRLS